MSCAIVNIIYGIQLTQNLRDQAVKWFDNDATVEQLAELAANPYGDEFWENLGFTMLYSASGYSAGYLGTKFEEFNDYTEAIQLQQLNRRAEAKLRESSPEIAAVPKAVNDFRKKYGFETGTIAVYIVFSSG